MKSENKKMVVYLAIPLTGITMLVALLLHFGQPTEEGEWERWERKQKAESADRRASAISYFKDHRTGLCFAQFPTVDGYSYTTVPCDTVASLLDNPDPP